MNITFSPFPVPDFVYQVSQPTHRQAGFVELPKWDIKDLSDEELGMLCNEFRDNVFKKKRGRNQ